MLNDYQYKNSLAFKQLKDNWAWYCIFGISLICIGSLAVVFSLISTLISIFYLGILFILIGIVEGFQSIKMNQWGTFLLHIILSVFLHTWWCIYYYES